MTYSVAAIVNRALGLLRVRRGGEVVDAEDMAEGVDTYNALMHSLPAHGLSPHDEDDVSYIHATQAAVDEFPLADKHFEGVAAIVASRLAPVFGKDVPFDLADATRMGWTALRADFISLGTMSIDRSLTALPSQTAKITGE